MDSFFKYSYDEIYTTEELSRIQSEFTRLQNVCYLDHAGATLYSETQIQNYNILLQENLFGNPHSRNPSSQLTTDAIDGIRNRILAHFGTNSDEYAVIFSSGATSGLKILGESFTFNGGPFVYVEESHTSVVGMREIVQCGGIHPVPYDAINLHLKENYIKSNGELNNFDHEIERKEVNALVAIPAQCNFSGYKYPLEWIKRIKSGQLEPIIRKNEFNIKEGLLSTNQETPPNRWFVLLDAAAFVSTNFLDLSKFPADFVVISFYKMFGFPTGLGALLVRKESGSLLRKQYIGGGTVEILIPSSSFHVHRKELHHKFENGTIPFLSILSLNSGFDTWLRLGLSLEKISTHTFRLAEYAYRILRDMKYGNGQPVARIYTHDDYNSKENSGPILTFNLLRQDGTFIGYSQVEEIAYLSGIHLRYGCFCNPGACRKFLGYEPQDLLDHFAAGHVCGDMHDLVDGRPTGAIRASFGYMTLRSDVDQLLDMIYRTFLLPVTIPPQILKTNQSETTLSTPKLSKMFIYPIKSCRGFEIRNSWPLSERGLLYDREWLIMNSMGVPLTQKRESRLCGILPSLDLKKRILHLKATGVPDLVLSLDPIPSNSTTLNTEICNSKVCGERVSGMDCGNEASDWLSVVLDQPGLKLVRILPNFIRKQRNTERCLSLANDSQYLLVTSGSLLALTRELSHGGLIYSDSESDNEDLDQNSQNLILKKSAKNLLRRFRTNFYVEIETPYDEENWDEVEIGNYVFKSGGPCSRCGTVCMDQKSGIKNTQPLLQLASRKNGNPKFGIHLSLNGNIINGKLNEISIGDNIQIKYKKFNQITSNTTSTNTNTIRGKNHPPSIIYNKEKLISEKNNDLDKNQIIIHSID